MKIEPVNTVIIMKFCFIKKQHQVKESTLMHYILRQMTKKLTSADVTGRNLKIAVTLARTSSRSLASAVDKALTFFITANNGFLYRSACNFPRSFSDSELGRALLRAIIYTHSP